MDGAGDLIGARGIEGNVHALPRIDLQGAVMKLFGTRGVWIALAVRAETQQMGRSRRFVHEVQSRSSFDRDRSLLELGRVHLDHIRRSIVTSSTAASGEDQHQ